MRCEWVTNGVRMSANVASPWGGAIFFLQGVVEKTWEIGLAHLEKTWEIGLAYLEKT